MNIEGLSLGDSYKQKMKKIHTHVKEIIDKQNYGLKEDRLFIIPEKITDDGVAQLNTRKRKSISKCHDTLSKIQELCVKASRQIEKAQEHSYHYVIVKDKRRSIIKHESQAKRLRKKAREDVNKEREANMNYKKPENLFDILDENEDYFDLEEPNLQ